jgi:cell division protein FtsL
MIEKNKKINSRNKKDVFIFLIFIIIVIAISIPLFKNIKQTRDVDKEIAELKEEITIIEGKNNELKNLMIYVGSEEFLEEQARINFGLKKEGEEVLVVQKNDILINNNSAPKENDTIFNIQGLNKPAEIKKISNPGKWLNYFLKK